MGLLDSLVANWPLDEASGTRYDAHASFDLSEVSGVGRSAGLIGYAASFPEDEEGYLTRGSIDGTDLSLGDVDFTIAFWAKASSLGGLLLKWDGGLSVYTASGGVLIVNVSGTEYETEDFATGAWQFVVVDYRASDNRLRVHLGATTNSWTVTPPGSSEVLIVGDDVFLTGDKWVDELSVWTRILSDTERSSLYNGGSGRPYSSFVEAVLLESSIGGTSSVGGNLYVEKPLQASVVGQSSVGSQLTVEKTLQASAFGASAFSGNLTVEKPLQGSITGSSNVGGQLTVEKLLQGSFVGSGTLTGTLTLSVGLSAAFSGTSEIIGNLSVAKPLGAALSGSSSVGGNLSVTKELAASITGTAVLSASLGSETLLQAGFSGSSALSASLTVTKALGSSIAGTSNHSGELTVEKLLSATFSGYGALSASMSATKTLEAAIVGSSEIVAHLSVTVPYSGSSVVLVFPPNWSHDVDLTVEVPVDRQDGLNGHEARMPHGETLRAKMSWKSTLSARELTEARDTIGGIGGNTVVVPIWPLAVRTSEFDEAEHCTASLLFAWTHNWKRSVLGLRGKIDLELYDMVTPALIGTVVIDMADMHRADAATVRFEFSEDSTSDRALIPPARTWTAGPALNDDSTPDVFPFDLDWSAPTTVGLPAVIVERRRMGKSRQAASEYHPQDPYLRLGATVTLGDHRDVAGLLRWWQDARASAAAHYVPVELQTGMLSADVAAGASELPLADADEIGEYRFLALRTPGQTEIVRVTSLPADVATLSGTTAHAWDCRYTLVCHAALARHDRDSVTLKFACPGIARAAIDWRELPAEYDLGEDEDRGDTIGKLATTAWLYAFTVDLFGAQTVFRLTGYEGDLTVGGNAHASVPIDHTQMRVSSELTSDEVTIRMRWRSEFSTFLPGGLTSRITVAVSECEVAGGVPGSATLRWSGEIVRAEFDGPFLQLTARGPYALFDSSVPRLVMLPQCNHTVFDSRCGLVASDWTFTASRTASSANSITLGTWAKTGGLPTGWGGLNYFALAIVERSNGERLLVLSSTAVSSGSVTLTLDRNPSAAWGSSESVSVLLGCDGLPATCQAYHATDNPGGRFNNFPRFGGFPFVPATNPSFTPIKRTTDTGAKK